MWYSGALVLALFPDDGRAYARMAQDVGIPVGSIGPKRARVLAHLRRQLRPGLTAT